MKSSSPRSPNNALAAFRNDLKSLSNPAKAQVLRRFFKTGPGEYAEGDQFLGLTVPQTRGLVKKYQDLPLSSIKTLIRSPIHEERLAALLILVRRYRKEDERKRIFDFYAAHLAHVNNWDLVDSSAEHIVGPWLLHRGKSLLYRLAKSENLWERRVAMLSTFHYIKRGDARDALKIAEALLSDQHDLIHKAVGWMLREVGKRCSLAELESFLQKHGRDMSRTTLRYAIERLPAPRRMYYLRSSRG